MGETKRSNLHAGQDPGRFCRNCGLIFDLNKALCPECGDRATLLSYCDVCERFWRLPTGTPCPKHDLPLAESTVSPARSDPERIDWATVKTFPTLPLAEAPRIRLEAEGIPTFLDGERMAGNLVIHNNAVGGVKLQVPRELVGQARILLDQTWSLPDDPEGIEDAWEDLGPDPAKKRMIVMRAAIVLFLLAPFLGAIVIELVRTTMRLLFGL